jgi:hypothetical protein
VILQRRGGRLVSVTPAFHARALTEIAFRPGGSVPGGAVPESPDAFLARCPPLREVELSGEADGPIQGEAESRALGALEGALEALVRTLGPNQILFIENDPVVDWPKTRERRKDVVIAGENRFHFHWRIEPALRLTVRERPLGLHHAHPL